MVRWLSLSTAAPLRTFFRNAERRYTASTYLHLRFLLWRPSIQPHLRDATFHDEHIFSSQKPKPVSNTNPYKSCKVFHPKKPPTSMSEKKKKKKSNLRSSPLFKKHVGPRCPVHLNRSRTTRMQCSDWTAE